MKKVLSLILIMLMVVGIGGCESEENKNLDLTDTIITEYTPESGVWTKQKYSKTPLGNSTRDTLEQVVKGFYPDHIFDNDRALIRTYKNNEPVDLPYSEATDDERAVMNFMRYISDEIYVEMFMNNKFEMYNRKTVLELSETIGKEWESEWMWRPHFSGSTKKTIEITSETDLSEAYPLNGNDVSISEAFEFAEKTLTSGEIPYICASSCKVSLVSVDVMKFDDTHYGYTFRLQITYDNVPLDASKSTNKNNTNYICPVDIYFFTYTGNTVDWIWTTPLNGDSVETKECSSLIGYEEACRIVSKQLSSDFVFDVETAELMYSLKVLETGEDEGLYIIPTWRFRVIDLSGFNDFSVLYVYVDAETKEAFVNYAVG